MKITPPPLPMKINDDDDDDDEDDDDEAYKIPTHHLVFCPLGFCPLGFIPTTPITGNNQEQLQKKLTSTEV